MVKAQKAKFQQGFKLFLCAALMLLGMGVVARDARAQTCEGCTEPQCSDASDVIVLLHEISENVPNPIALMPEWTTKKFNCYRHFLTGPSAPGNPSPGASCQEDFYLFQDYVLPGLTIMTEQMTAVAMQSLAMIGKIFDAKHQLETSRTFEELQFQAHRDYLPSEDFCWFGTNVRSLAASEAKARFTQSALGGLQMARHLGSVNVGGAENRDFDKAARWKQFQQNYCDPKDNNWEDSLTGLEIACQRSTPADPARVNIDIDYIRLVEEPRSLDISFTNGGAATSDEADVIALSRNLYGHDVLTRQAMNNYLNNPNNAHKYMQLRDIAAKRAVAENSFNAIVAMKSSGSGGGNTKDFLYAIMNELGVSNVPPPTGGPSEAEKMLGSSPSYYAQLEILASRIFQNPEFYSNLYDTPVNISRKSVALKAIDLMLDRAVFESELRQEMALSVLLSTQQDAYFSTVEGDLEGMTE